LEFTVSTNDDVITDQVHPTAPETGDPSEEAEISGASTVTDSPDSAEGREVGPIDAASPVRERKRRLLARFRRTPWIRAIVYGVLPATMLILAGGAGWLNWQISSQQQARTAATQSVQAATDSTIAILSYAPDTAAKVLDAAGDRLTGQFKDEYHKLITDVVIPGAQQKKISATARLAAAASVSASDSHAVVLVFVDQTIIMGGDPPTDTASAVRVTLDKVGPRWLVSAFDPV
jgi:Mce-associated membrane protein